MTETPDGPRDASRRTHLANERTYLAWWRTGIAALAISFAAGGVLPQVSSSRKRPLEAIAIAFAVVGIGAVVHGYRRHQQVEAALARGENAPLGARDALVFAGAAVLLGVAVIVFILTG